MLLLSLPAYRMIFVCSNPFVHSMADDDSIGVTAGQQPQDYKCTAIGIEPPRDTTTVTHHTMNDDPLTSKDTAA